MVLSTRISVLHRILVPRSEVRLLGGQQNEAAQAALLLGPPEENLFCYGESVAQNVGVIERRSCESREVLVQACDGIHGIK